MPLSRALRVLEGHQGQEDDDKHLQHPGLKPHGLQQIVNGFW